MAKKIVGLIKLQVPAGKANPSPPIGPALGQRGLNIMEFCKAFNAQTSSMEPGLVLPVVITAFADKSFTFVLKSPPASVLIWTPPCAPSPVPPARWASPWKGSSDHGNADQTPEGHRRQGRLDQAVPGRQRARARQGVRHREVR